MWRGVGMGVISLVCLWQFIQVDTTNEHPYQYPDYVCKHFAKDFQINASHFNLPIRLVHIRNETIDHILCAYYISDERRMKYGLVDERWIFIEPQTDEVFFRLPYKNINEMYIGREIT